MSPTKRRSGPTLPHWSELSLAARIRVLCALKDWDRTQLARASGLCVPTLHRINAGKSSAPHSSTIRVIAQALGVSERDLQP